MSGQKVRRWTCDTAFFTPKKGKNFMNEGISTNATRASLLGRVIERDDVAWRQFVELYGPLVVCWCRRFKLDSHGISDVMQEVFLSVSNSIGRFRSPPGEGAFRGWLWRITRNKLLDRRRQQNRYPTADGGSTALRRLTSIADPISIPDEEPSDDNALKDLSSRALKQLQAEFQPQTWTAFWRSAIDGMTSEIVAVELGMSAAGVRQARSRILRRLRGYLNEGMDDASY